MSRLYALTLIFDRPAAPVAGLGAEETVLHMHMHAPPAAIVPQNLCDLPFLFFTLPRCLLRLLPDFSFFVACSVDLSVRSSIFKPAGSLSTYYRSRFDSPRH